MRMKRWFPKLTGPVLSESRRDPRLRPIDLCVRACARRRFAAEMASPGEGSGSVAGAGGATGLATPSRCVDNCI